MKAGFVAQLVNCGSLVGEVVIHPLRDEMQAKSMLQSGLHIDHYSASSERVKPHVVLHTISQDVWFKLSPKSMAHSDWQKIKAIHEACIGGSKTAVVLLNDEQRELHLVAMFSKVSEGSHPCFWAYSCTRGLYASCLGMLNLRCLGLVFDLDETLLVANTSRSFEDRIDEKERKIKAESDPGKKAAHQAECNRLRSDRALLRQFAEKDELIDEEGVVHRAQPEVVIQESGETFTRPVLRVPRSNIILTRIQPAVRDTSVLVRMRPAWEEMRKYVVTKERKRFEVYVCTMSEREYALEMWRLLDPDATLISISDMAERVVCVRGQDAKKSLASVFQRCKCHPSMAIVVDDRLKVWLDADQSRVHVVPAYSPYHSQAEMNLPTPILRIVMTIACGVRGDFYKNVDEVLEKQLQDITFDTETSSLPLPPDVATFLKQQEVKEPAIPTGPSEGCFHDGMAADEVAANMRPRAQTTVGMSSTVPPHGVLSTPPIQLSFETKPFAGVVPATLPASSGGQLPAITQSVAVPATISYQPMSSQLPPVSLSSSSQLAGEHATGPDPASRLRMLIQEHGQESPRAQDGKPSVSGGWGRVRAELSSGGNLIRSTAQGPTWQVPRTNSWGRGASLAIGPGRGTPAVPVKGPPDEELEPGELMPDDELPEWDDKEIEDQKKLGTSGSLASPSAQGPVTNGVATQVPAAGFVSPGAVPGRDFQVAYRQDKAPGSDLMILQLVGTLEELMKLSGASPTSEMLAQISELQKKFLDFMEYSVQKVPTSHGSLFKCEVVHKGQVIGVGMNATEETAKGIAAESAIGFLSNEGKPRGHEQGHVSPPAHPAQTHPFSQAPLLPPVSQPALQQQLPPPSIPHSAPAQQILNLPPIDPLAIAQLQQILTIMAQQPQPAAISPEYLQQALIHMARQNGLQLPPQQGSQSLLSLPTQSPRGAADSTQMQQIPTSSVSAPYQVWPGLRIDPPPTLQLPVSMSTSNALSTDHQPFRGGAIPSASAAEQLPHPNAYTRSASRLSVSESPRSGPGSAFPWASFPGTSQGSAGMNQGFRKPTPPRAGGGLDSPSARPLAQWLQEPFVPAESLDGDQRMADGSSAKYDAAARARFSASPSASQDVWGARVPIGDLGSSQQMRDREWLDRDQASQGPYGPPMAATSPQLPTLLPSSAQEPPPTQSAETSLRDRQLPLRDSALKRPPSFQGEVGSSKRPRVEDSREQQGEGPEVVVERGWGGNGIDLNLMPDFSHDGQNEEHSPSK